MISGASVSSKKQFFCDSSSSVDLEEEGRKRFNRDNVVAEAAAKAFPQLLETMVLAKAAAPLKISLPSTTRTSTIPVSTACKPAPVCTVSASSTIFSSKVACKNYSRRISSSSAAACNVDKLEEMEGMTTGGTVFNFAPLILQWQFKDNDLFDCIGVMFSLPHGLVIDVPDLKNRLHISVSDDGAFLIVKCIWPDKMTDPLLLETALTKVGMDDTTVQAAVTGFRSEIRAVKKIVGNDYPGSVAKIQLRSVCECKIYKKASHLDRLTVFLRVAGQDAENEEEEYIDIDEEIYK